MESIKGNSWDSLGASGFHNLAEKYGTPFFLYDADAVTQRIKTVRESFQNLVKVFYAVKANPNLELLGVLMTMFDGRTKLSQQVVGEVRQHFGPVVFETVIPRTTRLAEAPSFGKPIIYYDKYSAGAAAYEVLTQEVLARLKL
jgi:cellulose biosynthesis protein BcsQ